MARRAVDTAPALPAELSTAIEAARAALEARQHIVDTIAGAETKHRTALATKEHKTAEVAALEADAAFTADPGIEAQAKAARGELTEAELTISRHGHFMNGARAKLAEADAAIEAAVGTLKEAANVARVAATAALAEEMTAAAAALAAVMRKGYALGTVYGGFGEVLGRTHVPLPGSQHALISGPHSRVTGAYVNLNEQWREDEGATAVHDLHRPVADLLSQGAAHLNRIERERQAAAAKAQTATEPTGPRVFHVGHVPIDAVHVHHVGLVSQEIR